MRLNIGIDIDGTVTDPYYWLKYVNEYFKSNLKAEDVVKFDICRILNLTEEEYDKFYELKGEQIHEDCIAREGAREIVNKLAKNNNIYFITARPEKYREVTEKWLRDNGFKGEVYMIGGHNKVGQAKELNCDYFVEDRYRNAVTLAKAGIKVFLIDTNYNRYPLIENMTRVSTWNEIYKAIEKDEEIAS